MGKQREEVEGWKAVNQRVKLMVIEILKKWNRKCPCYYGTSFLPTTTAPAQIEVLLSSTKGLMADGYNPTEEPGEASAWWKLDTAYNHPFLGSFPLFCIFASMQMKPHYGLFMSVCQYVCIFVIFSSSTVLNQFWKVLEDPKTPQLYPRPKIALPVGSQIWLLLSLQTYEFDSMLFFDVLFFCPPTSYWWKWYSTSCFPTSWS